MNTSDGRTSAIMQVAVIVEDIIILPLVLLAVALKISVQGHAFDSDPYLGLRLPRFAASDEISLFTARIMGDGVTAVVRSAIGFLPVTNTKPDEWRELLSRYWSWLRQKISHKAFEEAVHYAFEHEMAWVFKKSRTLTPRSALLVIAGVVLWLPASFGAATALHAMSGCCRACGASRALGDRWSAHRPTRRRERQMQRFKSSSQAQRFL